MSTYIKTFTIKYLNYEYRVYLHNSGKDMHQYCLQKNWLEVLNATAFFIQRDEGSGDLHFNRQHMPIDIIVHEISHAVFHQIKAGKQNKVDDEQYAHSMQWMVERFLTALNQVDIMPNQYFYKMRFYDLKF